MNLPNGSGDVVHIFLGSQQHLLAEAYGLAAEQIVVGTFDLRSAMVFISILGNPDQQKRGLVLLEENRARIQNLVARSVVLKYFPTFKFVFDNSLIRGNRVLQIIDELEQAQPSAASPESEG